ncbi:MAG TPA: HAMP domain-containing sensor histidine kinase, partial [Rhizomicrobium sp.]|nr:HAMP domain-containing sensor histidine kinase [Rhizomicrobium sp.]
VGTRQRPIEQVNTDGRVVKAQLDFVCEDLRSARYTALIWGAIIAALASSYFGYFGHTPLWRCLVMVGVISLMTLTVSILAARYKTVARNSHDIAVMRRWFHRFTAMEFLTSLAWGAMPWLLWEDGNQINHLALGGLMAAAIAMQSVMRINHANLFLATLMPMLVCTIARFLTGDSVMDFVMGGLFVLYGIQFNMDGGRLTRRVSEDTRLRFQVEDLARELEETRDEALRKRFEAETANASKTAFLANMSHELRTPLNAILGFSEIIAQECFGPTGSPRYKEYAGDIHASGAHLLSLINDLLDVAKIEAGKMDIDPTPLDVHEALNVALKIMTPKAREKRQELVVDVRPDTPPLFADERALKQILINLVSNAIKFTPEGGRIGVIASKAAGGAFQVVVEDNGPGIPSEKLDRIFTPFNQVDNRYDRQAGGTGLGLALVRGLAELHGGRAWIESEYGQGCKVFVVLPSEPVAARRNEIAAA